MFVSFVNTNCLVNTKTHNNSTECAPQRPLLLPGGEVSLRVYSQHYRTSCGKDEP